MKKKKTNNKKKIDKTKKVDNKKRIGKPQKSQRHKKIKNMDPDSQETNAKKKRGSKQINEVPDMEQKAPRSLKDLFAFKNAPDKRKKKTKAEIEYGVTLKGMTKPVATPKSFKQKKKETDAAFMRRVNKETEAALNIAKFNEKFNVDLLNMKKGSKDSPLKPISEKRKRRLKVLTERKKQKKLAKKQKRLEKD
ncbi:DgyrCDS14279 [Dimorphilus gyrociliatus]|uniref:DgyrCDS14279 n=1 Tax=Dimorphilus gyrociliatus TaxID=2664684 RepID=A0A7I8WDI5_9ANNE|nr:DgyrCDS14279 [Dimorphilus gyrociliatus]